MATNYGKVWEAQFKENWKKCFPNTFIFRLKDQMNGFRETSGNPCDFLCFPGNNKLFMIECKEHKGASIPFAAIPQYNRLLEYKKYPGIYPGVLLWLSEKDLILWISIAEMEKMIKEGKKSISIKMLEDPTYNIVVIPSVKKRVFLEADYTVLLNLQDKK